MRYEGTSENIPFTVTPNDMYDKAMEIDTNKSTRKVLAYILRKVVSETKKKINGEWETKAEGFAPKTWIARDLNVSTDTVSRDLEELRERKIITTEDDRFKTYKVIEDGKEKYYKRETTYVIVNQNTDEWILDRAPRKKRVAELI